MPGPRSAAHDEPIGLPPATAGQLRSARRLSSRKERSARRQFLVEGPQAVWAAVPQAAELLLLAPGAVDRHRDLVARARAHRVPVAVTDEVEALAHAVTPQGVIAVARDVVVDLRTALAGAPRLVMICAQVRDPGNAGTVIRCADAFGADAVILTHGSVDPTNPKTVRATAGSLFHLPVCTGVTLDEAIAACRAAHLQVLATGGSGAVELDTLQRGGSLARPLAWVMGNEAWGLPAEDAALADAQVRVPMWGGAESLNLSTAAAVCLYSTAVAQRHAV